MEMTPAQKNKRERIAKAIKTGREKELKSRYGDDWENVVYATATKQALKEDDLKDMDQLMNDAAAADKKRRSIYYELMHGLTEEQKEKLVGKKKRKQTTEVITEPTTDDTVTYGQPKTE